MKPATISDIKSALQLLTQKELIALCAKMASFRKENKEMLTYLLFEADDQAMFIRNVKEEMDDIFDNAASNMYLARKTYRKALKAVNKYIRFAGNKTTEVELLIYFCQCMNNSPNPIHKYKVTSNMYQRQVIKIEKALQSLHEDLQYDYGQQLEELKKAGEAGKGY
ncbi:MAG: hypothetical protein ACOC12_00395 [Bacteroidota bacterium]